MDDSAFDDARDNCSDKRNGESVVDVEFEWSFCIIMSVMWKDIQKASDEIERFSCDIGDLENWTNPLTDELSRGVDTLFLVLDEDWDFPSARGFQNSGDLLDSLFQDLGRTDIDFGDDDHDWNIKSQCDT